uniref:C-type cytochrome n=1 Tax=Roseihalotalea indica TaxID=2867963 RepID=A0AA49GJV3_9BACT|nr:c-type cytochrome [Tunicatimonas sp. TK19036]
MQTFQLEDGFRIELVASEPLIQDPVALDFDAQGRIWVVEMQSYMPDVTGQGEDQPTGRIVILEDHDDDGLMDHTKVFMDSLVLPRTLRLAYGGILYAEPPNLWFVENNNDSPGKKTLIDTAYAVGGNVEHQPNGMLRGMDNWYYNAKSKKRYRLQEGKWISEETEFRGQWGMAMDDEGRLFYNTNSNQLRGDLVPPSTMSRNPDLRYKEAANRQIVKDQRVYPVRPTPGVNRGYKEDVLDEEKRLTTFTAACGPVIYRGDNFPEAYHGNAFVCEPSGNLIKRNILSDSGAYITAEQAYSGQEFLASTDERFRPVSLYNGPEGALYMVDMYRGIIQHETYVTDYLRDQILSRGLEKPIGLGRIYRIVYEGNWWERLIPHFGSSAPALQSVTDQELVGYLSHPNGWWRDEAQRLLVERNSTSVVPELRELLNEDNSLAKIHALWTLEGMGEHSSEIILKALQDDDPLVVVAGLRIGERNVGLEQAKEVLHLYEALSEHADPKVQLQLALSLGEFLETDSASVMQMLTSLGLEQGHDPLMQEAIISSVHRHERELLASLSQETPQHLEMITALKEVITNTELKKQLASKTLTPEEQKQFVVGKSLYEKTCAGCHQDNGEGMTPIAPPLAGSEWVTGPQDRLIRVVLHGLMGPVTVNGKVYQEPEVQPVMPGLKDNPEFTDDKLAAVLTYVRNVWGNEADSVEPSTVKEIREQAAERESPFREQDFIP